MKNPDNSPRLRAMRAKTMKMTYDGIEYACTVSKDRHGMTTISFKSSRPPQGLDEEIYSFRGRLPR